MTLGLQHYSTLPDLESASGSVSSPLLWSRGSPSVENLHPSDLVLPITNNTPWGPSVNIAPPKEREAHEPIDFDLNWDQCGWRPAAKWSRTRCLWSCCSWSCPPPIVTSLLCSKTPPQYFSPLFIFHLTHTNCKGQKQGRNGGWKERAVRERMFIQPHVSQSPLCLCVCVRVCLKHQADVCHVSNFDSFCLRRCPLTTKVCHQSLSEHLCTAAVSLCPFNTTYVITTDVCWAFISYQPRHTQPFFLYWQVTHLAVRNLPRPQLLHIYIMITVVTTFVWLAWY